MRLPNLLASRAGRLTAFFFLYVTEGIPLGFTATAIATQMRRQGLGVAEVTAFVASLYLPWSFKFLYGPFVDVFASERFGRRRAWIVATQILMVAMLLVALPVGFDSNLRLFTLCIIVLNVFCATQDVAIDALAVNTLREDERGTANGMMFAGAYIGQAVGGAGVLFLSSVVPFSQTFFFVAAAILAVTVFVALPLQEPKGAPRAGGAAAGAGLQAALGQVVGFLRESWRAFAGSRSALVGVVLALLPAGAYALGMALSNNLAVELGMKDDAIGWLNLLSTVLAAAGCVAGGWLSDRLGRRRMLALFVALTVVPTLTLAWQMQRFGWILPVSPTAGERPAVPADLLWWFWATALGYAVVQGLMYGTRSAIFMDVTSPAVAATQFTAYMALLNLAISYSGWWQGRAAERWGYPVTLGLDAAFGVVCLALLPFMKAREKAREGPVPAAGIPEAVEP